MVKFEAESGALGASWTNGTDVSIQYISTATNGADNNPSNSTRVVTYTVTFPAAGAYDLYVHLRVGSGAASDDSFLYANGFGSKSPGTDTDWILCNNLNAVGYTAATDIVAGGGSAGAQVWKWVNVSEFNGGETPVSFTVTAGNLTQTFQIGSREDGLWIDSLVFGSSSLIFTVANLDAGDDGNISPDGNASCSVNWSSVRQVVDGFGASSAWRSTWSAALAEMFFSTNSGTGFGRNGASYSYTGVGLSLLRTRIAPGGTTVENNIMQLAQARGARVWSAPWSPAPAAQFKSNTNVNGGSFIGNTINYQDYAAQLAKYAVNMKKQYGINLYALSIQNEPDANVTTYESCNWTAQQIHDFIPYLSAALIASNASATKIMLPESQNWTDPQGLRLTTMNDPTTAALVGIIANHNYVGNNAVGDQTTPTAITNYGKSLWETEVAKLSGNDSSMTDGLYWAGRVHLFLTAAQANAWHYWWLCSGSTTSGNEGLADTNDVPAKRMYAIGNFSRFVRPGFYRIDVTNNTGPLQISAYKNLTNGNFAIVAINSTTTNYLQTFNLNGFTVASSVTPWLTSASVSLAPQSSIAVSGSAFTNTIPAQSVVTFTGQAVNSPPSLAAISSLTTNAGFTLNITNTASDPEAPGQTLTFSLLTNPAFATLNNSNGVFTWRPHINQANTTNLITVKVTDNGSPNLSATNSYAITVNPVASPSFSSIDLTGDQTSLIASGPLGLDYTLLTSTNLNDWQALLITNPAVMPLQISTTNSTDPQRYYRLQLGP